jgi:hypothetical protein
MRLPSLGETHRPITVSGVRVGFVTEPHADTKLVIAVTVRTIPRRNFQAFEKSKAHTITTDSVHVLVDYSAPVFRAGPQDPCEWAAGPG